MKKFLFKSFWLIGYAWAGIVFFACMLLNIVFIDCPHIDYIWIAPILILYVCILYDTFHFSPRIEKIEPSKSIHDIY